MTVPDTAPLRDEAMRLHRAGKRSEAAAAYAVALSRVPGDAALWSNLGALHRAEGRHDLALAAQERAHALDPENRDILNNLANILNDIGEHERALVLRHRLMVVTPDDPAQPAMAAKALRALRRYAQALDLLDRALIRHPGNGELRVQLALTQLAAGDYAAGFRSYGARWASGELTPPRMKTPKWDGGMLDGKTILVLPEQGFGDAVTFARFLPVLRRYNPARVMLLCEGPLLRLMQGVEGADWVGTRPGPDDPHDVWTNMMDLPVLHFDHSTVIPPPTRLTVPEDSRARARAIIAPHRDRFRIGVVWSGSITYRANAFRSFSHQMFHRLLDLPGVQMFSLYKGPELAGLRADGSDTLIFDTGSHDRDFADCAALMQEMDLILTSCTATSHIAGSLGLNTWTLLHWDAFWLWQLAEEHTPWYPAMRLIRQKKPRDWDGVFARIHADLAPQMAPQMARQMGGR